MKETLEGKAWKSPAAIVLAPLGVAIIVASKLGHPPDRLSEPKPKRDYSFYTKIVWPFAGTVIVLVLIVWAIIVTTPHL